MAEKREIRDRLKSIKNTKKTTKAMELVAASKMRRSVQAALSTRPYELLASDIVKRLRHRAEIQVEHPLHRFFVEPEATGGKLVHTTIVLMTSNRGLCGAFNSNVIRALYAYMREHSNETIRIIGMGKKGITTATALGLDIGLAYEKNDSATNETAINEVAVHVYTEFNEGRTDKVMIAYTDYQSAIAQTAVVRQLFPLPLDSAISGGIDSSAGKANEQNDLSAVQQYIYEPEKQNVLAYLIPRIAQVQIFQALLESNASEHSSRMIAMKNATDSASEMADELTLAFNRARQAGITQEIAEISAGTAAVS